MHTAAHAGLQWRPTQTLYLTDMLRLLATTLMALSAALLSGCVATTAHLHRHKSVPPGVVIDVSSEPVFNFLSKPIGAALVPDSQVYVLSSQKGVTGLGLFGLLGALVVDAANQPTLASEVTRAFGFRLDQTTREAMSNAAREQGQNLPLGTSQYVDRVKGRAMLVAPAVMLARVSDTHFRAQVILYAVHQGETGVDHIMLNFIAQSPESRALTGEGSWSEGSRLRDEANRLVRALSHALVQELTSGLPRSGLKQGTLALPLPDDLEPHEATVAYLEDYRGSTLVYYYGRFHGVYLMPPNLVQPKDVKPWVAPAS